MARNRVHIDAAPEDVFAVLSKPGCYPEWVVGGAGVRDHDENFPEVGSRFHHKVGGGRGRAARPSTRSAWQRRDGSSPKKTGRRR